jgi:hypothetical protein
MTKFEGKYTTPEKNQGRGNKYDEGKETRSREILGRGNNNGGRGKRYNERKRNNVVGNRTKLEGKEILVEGKGTTREKLPSLGEKLQRG